MKKLLVFLGILSYVLPVVADDDSVVQEPTGLDVSELIYVSEEPLTGEDGCTGTAFEGNFTALNPLQMAAVYVDGCPNEEDGEGNEIGKYLHVADDAAIENDGTLSGVSCDLCPIGHECAGVEPEEIESAVTESGILSSFGALECQPGTYSDETGLAKCKPCGVGTYQDTNGATRCEPASGGWYVEKEGASSQQKCPDGYGDGTATGGTSIYSCQKAITQKMCEDEQANFNTGTMTIKSGLNLPKMVNYRNLSNYCFGGLNCRSGYHKQNAWKWLLENAGEAVSVASCSISGTMYDKDKDEWVPCDNGQEPGTMSFTMSDNAPMKKFNMVMTCSTQTVTLDANNKPIIIVGYGDAGYDNFTREPNKCYDANGDVIADKTDQKECELVNGATWQLPNGSDCWMRNVDAPDQPWIHINTYDDASDCEASCMNGMNRSYPFVVTNSEGYPVAQGSNGLYYANVNNQFILQAVIVQNTCYEQDENGITVHEDVNSKENCSYIWYSSEDTWYGNEKGATPTSNIGKVTYVGDLSMNMSQMLALLQEKTENDPRYSGDNASHADENPVNICAANPITITWGDVSLEQNDPARTCTYGGDLITPQAKPTTDGSKLFLGWKPVVTTPTPAPAPGD